MEDTSLNPLVILVAMYIMAMMMRRALTASDSAVVSVGVVTITVAVPVAVSVALRICRAMPDMGRTSGLVDRRHPFIDLLLRRRSSDGMLAVLIDDRLVGGIARRSDK